LIETIIEQFAAGDSGFRPAFISEPLARSARPKSFANLKTLAQLSIIGA